MNNKLPTWAIPEIPIGPCDLCGRDVQGATPDNSVLCEECRAYVEIFEK